MIIRPGGGKSLSAVYAAGRFGKNDSFIINHLGGQSPLGDVLCSVGSEYAVQLSPDGSGRSMYAGRDITSSLGFGKAWYVRDRDSGEVWSICFSPAGDRSDEYEVVYQPSQATISSLRNKIFASLTIATTPDFPCEIWLVRLENRSAQGRSLSFTTYVEPCPGEGMESRYFDKQRLLLARKSLEAMPPEDDGRSGELMLFHSSTLPPASYQNEKSAFIGQGRTLRNPLHFCEDQPEGVEGEVREFVASLTVDIELPIEGQAEFGFCMGVAESAEQAAGIAAALGKVPLVEHAIAQARSQWTDMCAGLGIESQDGALDSLVNTWLPYQAFAGWMGQRTGGVCLDSHRTADSLRGLYSLAAAAPKLLKHHILGFAAGTSMASTYSDDAGSLVSLDPWDQLWLAAATARYVAETGDLDILQEQVELRDGPVLTVKEHCERAMRACVASTRPCSGREEAMLEQTARMWALATGGAEEFATSVRTTSERRMLDSPELPEKRHLPRRVEYIESVTPSLRECGPAQVIRETFAFGRHDSDAAVACCLQSLTEELILGLEPTYEGLICRPHMPESWLECRATRRFRGSIYAISIRRSEVASKKSVSIVVDGEPLLGDMIPCFADGAEHQVDVTVS